MVNMGEYANRLLHHISQANTTKKPVVYVGVQKSLTNDGQDLHLVNEVSGSTVVYHPDKHIIIGSKTGVEIPEELA